MSDSSADDVEAASSAAPSVVNEAASTPAAEDTPSVLDAVEAALKQGVEAGPPPAGNRSENAEATPATPEQEGAAEISEEEIKQYSPNAQSRIRELAALKNDLQSQLGELRGEVDTLKGDADSFRKFNGYLNEHGISVREANNAIEITRLIKSHDYERAFQVVTPIFKELARRTGNVLDPDLVEDVKLGKTPEERAREIQRLRMSEAVSKTRDQERVQREEQSQKTREAENWKGHVTTVATATDNWAKQKAESDPDWNQKQDLVANAVGVLVQREGFPKTVEGAIEISERALKQVEDSLRKFVPRPRSITPPPRATGPASPGNEPPPKTALEAVERALRG